MNYYLTLYLIYAALSIKCEKRTGAPEKNKAEDPCGIRLCLGNFTVLLFWEKLDIKIIIKIIKIFPRDALFCFAEFSILHMRPFAEFSILLFYGEKCRITRYFPPF